MALKLRDIAHAVGGRVVGDGGMVVEGIKGLDEARASDLTFYADRRYKEKLPVSRAGAAIVSEETREFRGHQIVVENPQVAYVKAAALFAPALARYPGVSPEACVHETCRLGRDVSVYPLVYIGKDAVIGEGVVLFPGVFIGDRVHIGDRTVLHPNVSILQDCIIGSDVIVHAGTVIGSDGFGFVREGPTALKIPQIGIVQIDDHVEIGANNCIDRAALGKTWIQRCVKTDNLVQVAHNVVVGEGTLVVAQAGISGSVRIGRGAVLGGQVGIADHLEIGDGAMIASQSGVMRSIAAGETVSGAPAMPHRQFMRIAGLMARLPQLSERLKVLEKTVAQMVKTEGQ